MCKTGIVVDETGVDELGCYHIETSSCLDSGVRRKRRERLKELVWKEAQLRNTVQENCLAGKDGEKDENTYLTGSLFFCTIPEVWIYSVLSR